MCFQPPPTVHADRCGPQTFSAFLLVISTGITQYNRRVNRMANYLLFIDILFEKIWIFLKRFLVLPKAPSFDIPSVLKFPLPGDKLKHPPPPFFYIKPKTSAKNRCWRKPPRKKYPKCYGIFSTLIFVSPLSKLLQRRLGRGWGKDVPGRRFFCTLHERNITLGPPILLPSSSDIRKARGFLHHSRDSHKYRLLGLNERVPPCHFLLVDGSPARCYSKNTQILSLLLNAPRAQRTPLV